MKGSASRYFLTGCLLALCVLLGPFVTANAQTTIAVRKCSAGPCDTAASLANDVRIMAISESLPFGAIVFTSSQQVPISAFVRVCPGPRGFQNGCLITSGDLGAIDLDNRVHAQAAGIPPIDIPAEYGANASQADAEIVEGYILTPGLLQFQGESGMSPWHNIFNPANWAWMKFFDHRTVPVPTYTVFTQDRIMVKFVDGSTAQLELFGIGAPGGHFFHFVPESRRNPNGDPYGLPPPPPATTVGAGFNLAPPWLNGLFTASLPINWCSNLTATCNGGAVYTCVYRQDAFPC